MQPVVIVLDCPACGSAVSVKGLPREWEHGVTRNLIQYVEERRRCRCGGAMTVTVRVTREDDD